MARLNSSTYLKATVIDSQRGFSLVEVLISATILTSSILAISHTLITVKRAVSASPKAIALHQKINALNGYLQSASLCPGLFSSYRGPAALGSTPITLMDPNSSSTTLYASGSPPGGPNAGSQGIWSSNSWTTTAVSLTKSVAIYGPNLDNFDTSCGGPQCYKYSVSAWLKLTFSPTNQSTANFPTQFTIPLVLTFHSPSSSVFTSNWTVSSCTSSSDYSPVNTGWYLTSQNCHWIPLGSSCGSSEYIAGVENKVPHICYLNEWQGGWSCSCINSYNNCCNTVGHNCNYDVGIDQILCCGVLN